MPQENFEIPVENAAVDWVSGTLDVPADETNVRDAMLFAHGAGAPKDSAFMTTVAAAIAAAGVPVLRFNYAYSERMQREERRLPPERRPRLEAVHHRALDVLRERFPEQRVWLAGKSMGGRISSYLASEGNDCAGLVFFGYPLHPPGKKERLRSDHFPSITQPALFLQGTRDALCDLELLEPALTTFGGKAELHRIEDADHDFKVPRRTGRSRDEVLNELARTTCAWML
ncbi:MAG: hypothetical protein GY711_10550 [bacterium]|nr:hypothetical protein [bacterium]